MPGKALLHERAFNGVNRHSIAIRDVREIPAAEAAAILEDAEPKPWETSVSEAGNSIVGQSRVSELSEDNQMGGSAPASFKLRHQRVRLPLRIIALSRYNGSCVFTGLRQPLPNGSYEAEIGHFQSLNDDGPDVILNVGPMSGTFHTLYDAGLLAFQDDFRIIWKETVCPRLIGMLNPNGFAKLPENQQFWPVREFVRNHRMRVFGASS